MHPAPIRLHPPLHVADLETALERAAAAPVSQRPAVYRDEVFPWAAARLLASRSEQPRTALLVIPVGTQPFAPLLAALGTPATAVALLVTSESERVGLEVEAALRQLPRPDQPRTQSFSIGDSNSGIDICRAVDAALFWAGDPWPVDVTLDVTGGRKATSAALGAIAGLRGFRQVYIESQQQPPGSGIFFDERLLQLDDVRAWMQEDDRSAAATLFAAGAFASAVEHFEALEERVLAGPAVLWMHQFAVAAGLEAPAERGMHFSKLSEQLPPGPIRDSISHLCTGDIATAMCASNFLASLQREGAWR